jgi:hypothetical protein
VFFQLNVIDATQAENDDTYDFVLSLAAGQGAVEEIAQGLRRTVGSASGRQVEHAVACRRWASPPSDTEQTLDHAG